MTTSLADVVCLISIFCKSFCEPMNGSNTWRTPAWPVTGSHGML